MAWTAPFMASSAAGGTPPGSMTTSGRSAAVAMPPRQKSRHATGERIGSLFACYNPGRKRAVVLRQCGDLGRNLQGNIAIDVCHLAVRLGRHGGVAGVGLCADAHFKRQRAQPDLVVFGRHVAPAVLAENRLNMPAIGAYVCRHIFDNAQYRNNYLSVPAQATVCRGPGPGLRR